MCGGRGIKKLNIEYVSWRSICEARSNKEPQNYEGVNSTFDILRFNKILTKLIVTIAIVFYPKSTRLRLRLQATLFKLRPDKTPGKASE